VSQPAPARPAARQLASSQLAPLLLALLFLLLAHAAALAHSPALACCASLSLALLIGWPLRARPVLLLVWLLVAGLATYALHVSGAAFLPLLLPPVVITATLGMTFARSLVAGRTPLIERVVLALNNCQMPYPDVPPYARRLTLVWAALLLGLALINLLLALFAVPDGALHLVGITPPLAVPLAWWSLFANGINYLVIGGFFIAEYAYRRRRFPSAVYKTFGDFLRRMAALGPAFWRQT